MFILNYNGYMVKTIKTAQSREFPSPGCYDFIPLLFSRKRNVAVVLLLKSIAVGAVSQLLNAENEILRSVVDVTFPGTDP